MNTNNIIIRLEKKEEYRQVENEKASGTYIARVAWSIMC